MSTFISYSTQDSEIVQRIVLALEQNGVKCFYAPRDIEPGSDYAAEIVKAIKDLDCVTLVFSKASNTSMYVLREINSAVLNNKMVIPFKIDDSEPSESMEFYLGATHWLTAYPTLSEAKISKLINAILNANPASQDKKDVLFFFEKPTMIDAIQAENFGYSIDRIAMETIQLDYLALSGNEYIINDELEGTVHDWIDMFINYPDMFSLMFYRDKMIGYWLMELINEDNYKNYIINGEQIVTAEMQEFYEFGGEFCCYVAIMPIIKNYENSTNYLLLFSSLFGRIVNLFKKDVRIRKIGISVYSKLQEQIVKKLGFVYVGTNPAHGKIYELSAHEIVNNATIQKQYPDFYALYTDN